VGDFKKQKTVLKIERGSSRSHCLEKPLWKHYISLSGEAALEALDLTVWRSRFGRGYGLVVSLRDSGGDEGGCGGDDDDEVDDDNDL
jgi:hypothetical protein